MRTQHVIVMLVVLGLAGGVHGYWTHRWDDFKAGVFDETILAQTPNRIGDWEAAEAVAQEENGYRPYSMSRRYLNRLHDKTAVASLISGIPGKVATHTPDVCYPGSGYTMKTEIQQEKIDLPNGGTFACYVAEFEKTTATGEERIRVRWSWNAGQGWEAPDYPRWVYARQPVLHKLYMVQPIRKGESDHPAHRELIAGLVTELSTIIDQ